MAASNLTREECETIIELIEEAYINGYAPSTVKANVPKALPWVMEEYYRRYGYTLPRSSLNDRIKRAKELYGLEADDSLWETSSEPKVLSNLTTFHLGDLENSVRNLLKKRRATLHEISGQLGISQGQALDCILSLQDKNIIIHKFGEYFEMGHGPIPGQKEELHDSLIQSDENNVILFGLISDNHLGSKYARLDALHEMYDLFEARGIRHVFNAGNWIDGEARFNKFDLIAHGMDGQIDYLVKHYPKRDGITTYAIAGDDHEGWWAQREGVDIGKYAEAKFQAAGRNDWVYLGYMEADLWMTNKNSGKQAKLRVMHPGGGSAYAISYSCQKIVESFEEHDVPDVLAVGHYHKLEIFNYRGVWIVQCGAGQDQTPFMRKKKIDSHIGGVVCTLIQDPNTGKIISCNDIYRYFTRAEHDMSKDRFNHHGPVALRPRSLGGI